MIKRHISALVLCVLMALSLAACAGDVALSCGKDSQGNDIPCDPTTKTRATTSAVATTTTTESSRSIATTTSTAQKTVTVTPTPPPAEDKTVTVVRPPETVIVQPPVPKQAMVTASFEQAKCNSQGVYDGDVNVTLYSTKATFHPGSNLDRAGFSFDRAPDFPVVDVLVNTADAPDQFHGYPLGIANGMVGTGPGQYLTFFVNGGREVRGFVFCALAPQSATW